MKPTNRYKTAWVTTNQEGKNMLKDKSQDKIVNGVDVTALNATIDAIVENGALARFRFQLDNRWLGGSVNRSAINAFYGAGEDQTRKEPFFFDNDEPPVLLGQDTAPNPAEYLLHALAGCLTTSIAYHAAARGIEIEKIDSEVSGDMDARPFLDLSDTIQPGFHFIDAKLKVKTSASAEEIRELAEFSPIYQTINGKTPVEIFIETY